ncbi:MAG: hypothetical protein ACRDY7_05500 [Acidimicrobiia bacterium]
MKRLAALLPIAALVVAGACGGSDSEATAEEKILLASADRMAESSGFRFESTTSVQRSNESPVEVRSTGAVDRANDLISLDADLANLPGLGLAGRTTILFDGRSAYYRTPEAMVEQVGKPWVRMGFDYLAKAAGGSVDDLRSQFERANPVLNVVIAAVAATDVTEVGPAVVRGVPTTHFKMALDLDTAAEEAPRNARGALAQLAETTGDGDHRAEIWLGEDGLPRRLVSTLDVTGTTAGSPTGVDLHIELFDYGIPLGLAVPAAGDTADAAQLIARGPAKPTG